MKKIFYTLLTGIILSCTPKNSVLIVRSNQADKIEVLASQELKRYLSELYPDYYFEITTTPISKGDRIYLGTGAHLHEFGLDTIGMPESKQGFLVLPVLGQGAMITSASGQGVLMGVYALAEQLGFGYSFTRDVLPETQKILDFDQWNFSDWPLVNERTVFNWHNFLSGCTGWNLEDWSLWIDQSQKMGYNTMMAHAYANNPIYTFEYKGMTKPVGYLATSAKGRDWSTEHVNDVRRLPGGHLFTDSIFGSKAAKVPDEQRVQAAQRLMGLVFQHAEERGMAINLAIDFDIVAGIPQNMVLALPETDRFLMQHKGIGWMGEKAGSVWLPRPDTPNGYDYYKTQVKTVLELYPQIDIYTLWKRAGQSVWTSLTLEQLPKEWQDEYLRYIDKRPEAKLLEESVSTFAQTKLIEAYRKAFDELGRKDVRLSLGTWQWKAFQAMNEFYPENLSVYILDSEIIRGNLHLHNKQLIDDMAQWIKKGKAIPIIWPHHDDGAYVGSPLKMYDNFNTTLTKLKAKGYGVIHWMTRPFEPFFIHHAKQTMHMTQNQNIEKTYRTLAEKWFGSTHAKQMSDYLIQWDQDMPVFGRETGEQFIDPPHYGQFEQVKQVAAQCDERSEMLKKVDTTRFNGQQLRMYNYFLNLETFAKEFYLEQDKYLKASKLIASGKIDEASKTIGRFNPEAVLRQYAKTIENGTPTKGGKRTLIFYGGSMASMVYCIASTSRVRAGAD